MSLLPLPAHPGGQVRLLFPSPFTLPPRSPPLSRSLGRDRDTGCCCIVTRECVPCCMRECMLHVHPSVTTRVFALRGCPSPRVPQTLPSSFRCGRNEEAFCRAERGGASACEMGVYIYVQPLARAPCLHIARCFMNACL